MTEKSARARSPSGSLAPYDHFSVAASRHEPQARHVEDRQYAARCTAIRIRMASELDWSQAMRRPNANNAIEGTARYTAVGKCAL